MRRGRNPRRAYDEDGREITPPTVGDMRLQGDVTAAVTCHGSRDVGVMMDMHLHKWALY